MVLRGWPNPEIAAFASAQIVDQRFMPREDYNPFNEPCSPRWRLAVPTRAGGAQPDAECRGARCGPRSAAGVRLP